MDGTLLQAWASHASLERIDGQDDPPPPSSVPGEGFGAPKPGKKRAKGDFRGIKLGNKTHRSGTDPDAFLARKSNAHPALPGYRGHVLMDNRHALNQGTDGSAINGRTTRHEGYAKSINACRGIEKVFGWIKQWAGYASSYRGRRPSVPETLAARHRESRCGVQPPPDRLQPDPPRQPAQTGNRGGMSSWLLRDVVRRRPPESPKGPEPLKSAGLCR